MKSAQDLLQVLTPHEKIRFVHNQRGKVLPYFTRNPERSKFANGFQPVVGSLVRRSMGLSMPKDFKGGLLDQEKLKADVNLEDVSVEEFMQLFSNEAMARVHLPRLLAYIPLSESKEATGDASIAEFIYQLFDFDDNEAWHSFIKSEQALNPYEKLILDNAKELEKANSKQETFRFMPVSVLRSKFTHDLNNLVSSSQFFDEHINTFLSFYYFTYSLKVISSIARPNTNDQGFKPYYALESERLSQSRSAADSFRRLRTSAKNLLIETDILDYINYLLDEEDYAFLPDIMKLDDIKRSDLEHELRMLVSGLNNVLVNKIDTTQLADKNLTDLISELRAVLTKNESAETISRYMRSFDEIAKLDFTKARGRLGKTFNISDELLITLVGVILGKEKMMLNDFFSELELREIYLDRSSRDYFTELLNERNLLEKMSDSGDAQYVKSLF